MILNWQFINFLYHPDTVHNGNIGSVRCVSVHNLVSGTPTSFYLVSKVRLFCFEVISKKKRCACFCVVFIGVQHCVQHCLLRVFIYYNKLSSDKNHRKNIRIIWGRNSRFWSEVEKISYDFCHCWCTSIPHDSFIEILKMTLRSYFK